MMASQREIPDVIACIRLIEKLCNAGRTRKAARVLELLERSKEITLEIRAYSGYVIGLCSAGEADDALNLLRRLHSEEGRCKPDVYLYNIVINAMLGKGRFEQVMKLLDEMRSKGIKPDAVTCNTMVGWMCKQGRLDEAIKMVTSRSSSYGWRTPGVKSYDTVLNALCRAERFVDAAKLLADMEDREGCSPSVVTFNILIRSLCSKSLSYRAITLLESMPQYGCKPDLHHYNQVIDCLCKEKKIEMVIECIEGFARFGRTAEALKLLDEVRGTKGFKPDPVKYSVLVVGLISEQKIHKAMKILDELNRSQVEVPSKCYSWIIKALCDIGDTDRAIDLLVYMVSNGCSPTQTSYASVVESLASVGLVKEGLELLNELSLRGALDKGRTKGLETKINNICSLE
ncbi:Pentatricopeptide repeat-containing protein At1g09900 [Linum grandiflorum]